MSQNMSSTPICRKHPWLFKPLKCDGSSSSGDICDCKLCSDYLRQQSIMGCIHPFRDANVTADDVICLINSGYQLTSQDILDIELNVHMDEIFKLYHQDIITVYPGTLKLNNSYSLTYHQLIQDEYAKVNNKFSDSPWDLEAVSENIDVTQIIAHPEVGWNASLLSLNPSVCIEHIPQINATKGEWDYLEMLSRSDPNLALNILRDDTSPTYVLEVSKNPRMSVDNVRDLLGIDDCREVIGNILQYSHPEVIVNCVDRGIIPSTRSHRVWMNNRLDYEWKDKLSRLLGYET